MALSIVARPGPRFAGMARSYGGVQAFVGAAHGREWGASMIRMWFAGMARSYDW